MNTNISGRAFRMDVIGVRPNRVDVDAMTAGLNVFGDRGQQYAYVIGTLAHTVLNLAQSHADCAEPRCVTCWELRHATATLAALPFYHYTFQQLREGIR